MKILAMAVFCLLVTTSCENDRGNSKQDEKTTNIEEPATRQTRLHLSATELISMGSFTAFPDLQLYMKDRSADFLHATRGSFASMSQSVITDSTGQELTLPSSTFFASIWQDEVIRTVHTLHDKTQSDELLNEFATLGFSFRDSTFNKDRGYMIRYYRSDQYPGKVLYYGETVKPWHWRDHALYRNCSWTCYVFEVVQDN